jgi:hypothetical protein
MAQLKVLVLRLRTRLRRRRLDRSIAWGSERPYQGILALREAQLRGMRERKRLAGALERVLEAYSRPAPLSSAAPIDRRAVETAKPVIEELIDDLRSADQVEAQGVAFGWCLLTDPCGPIYASPEGQGDPDDLWYAALSLLFALSPQRGADRTRPAVLLR